MENKKEVLTAYEKYLASENFLNEYEIIDLVWQLQQQIEGGI